MNDDLARLLDLPAAARLSVAGDELALLTLRHEHADKITIERQRLGRSIDLGELLQIVGLHGLAETPQIQVTEVTAPQLPAPVGTTPLAEPVNCPQCEKTFKDQHGLKTHMAMKHKVKPAGLACATCERTFVNLHALEVHQGRAHKAVAATLDAREPEPLPVPVLVAQSTAPSAIPVPVVSEYTCADCGVSLQLHERCSDCQALLGPEHEAGQAVEHGLCSVCVGYRATEHKLGLVAA
jgi:hypothetical protein